MDRFDTETIKILNTFESFVTGKSDNVIEIINFLNSSNEKIEPEFHADKLKRQRDIFVDTAKRHKVEIKSLKDVVNFLKNNDALCSI